MSGQNSVKQFLLLLNGVQPALKSRNSIFMFSLSGNWWDRSPNETKDSVCLVDLLFYNYTIIEVCLQNFKSLSIRTPHILPQNVSTVKKKIFFILINLFNHSICAVLPCASQTISHTHTKKNRSSVVSTWAQKQNDAWTCAYFRPRVADVILCHEYTEFIVYQTGSVKNHFNA